ncbi:MAG: hypothetical protein ACOH2N_16255 [Devosia sp.]
MVERARSSLRLIATIALSGLLVACVARPVGDFGRAEPGVLHDTMMPFAGDRIASMRGEPVSGFNKTDQEVEMADRVWRFLMAPHAKDWAFDASVELQRTRIIPPKDGYYRTDRYYEYLKQTPYQSSRTRYSTVGGNISIDIETLPSTFAAICAVIEIDQQRAAALKSLRADLPATASGDVAARKYENDAYIAWFVRALEYRYKSYDFALNSLVVETPHAQSLGVDDALQRLHPYVERANRHDFCGDGGSGRGRVTVVIPSRFQKQGDNEIVLLK